ncbi:MAG: hypothetical protein ACI4II_06785 [Acutalibacteraceae bacterium]
MNNSKKGFGLVTATIMAFIMLTFSVALMVLCTDGLKSSERSINEMKASLNCKSALSFAARYYEYNTTGIPYYEKGVDRDLDPLMLKFVGDKIEVTPRDTFHKMHYNSATGKVDCVLDDYDSVAVIAEYDRDASTIIFHAYSKSYEIALGKDEKNTSIGTATLAKTMSYKYTLLRPEEAESPEKEEPSDDITVNLTDDVTVTEIIDQDDGKGNYVTFHVKPAAGSDMVPYIYVWTRHAGDGSCTHGKANQKYKVISTPWIEPDWGNLKESKNIAGPSEAMTKDENGWYTFTKKFSESDFPTCNKYAFSAVISKKGSIKNVPMSWDSNEVMVKGKGDYNYNSVTGTFYKVAAGTGSYYVNTPPARSDTQTFDIFDLEVDKNERKSDIYITLNSEEFNNPLNNDADAKSLDNAYPAQIAVKEILDSTYTAYSEKPHVNVSFRLAGVTSDIGTARLYINKEASAHVMEYIGYGWYFATVDGVSNADKYTVTLNGYEYSTFEDKIAADSNTKEIYLIGVQGNDALKSFKTEELANDYFHNFLNDEYAEKYSTVSVKLLNTNGSASSAEDVTVNLNASYVSGTTTTSSLTFYFEAPNSWVTGSNQIKVYANSNFGTNNTKSGVMGKKSGYYYYTVNYDSNNVLPSVIHFETTVNGVTYRTVDINFNSNCKNKIYRISSYKSILAYSFSDGKTCNKYDNTTAFGGWYDWGGSISKTDGKLVYVAVTPANAWKNYVPCVISPSQGNVSRVMTKIPNNESTATQYYYAVVSKSDADSYMLGMVEDETSVKTACAITPVNRENNAVYAVLSDKDGKPCFSEDYTMDFGGISSSIAKDSYPDLFTVNNISLLSVSDAPTVMSGNNGTATTASSSNSSVIKTAASTSVGSLVETTIASGHKRIYFYPQNSFCTDSMYIRTGTSPTNLAMEYKNGLYYKDIEKNVTKIKFVNSEGSITAQLTVGTTATEYVTYVKKGATAYTVAAMTKYRTIYLKNCPKGGDMFAHYWVSSNTSGTKWNGALMTKLAANEYVVKVPSVTSGFDRIIFSYGKDDYQKTADLTIQTANETNTVYVFDWSTQSWDSYSTSQCIQLNGTDDTPNRMVCTSSSKIQYYDVMGNAVKSYGTIDSNLRTGTSAKQMINDWYTFKVPTNGEYSIQLEITKKSSITSQKTVYYTPVLSNLGVNKSADPSEYAGGSDIYITVNSNSHIIKSSLNYLNDYSLYTINPETDVTQKTVYFNDVLNWGGATNANMRIYYWCGGEQQTGTMKYLKGDGVYYFDLPANTVSFAFFKNNSYDECHVGPFWLEKGKNYYTNGDEDNGGYFQTAMDLLKSTVDEAIRVLNHCCLYEVSAGTYKEPATYMQFLHSMIISAQDLYNVTYTATVCEKAKLYASILSNYSQAVENLYDSIIDARVFIDGYPENSRLPDVYNIDRMSKAIILTTHETAVKLYTKEYSNINTEYSAANICAELNGITNRLNDYIKNIKVTLNNAMLFVLTNNAGWTNTNTSQIYLVIGDNRYKVTDLNNAGRFNYLYELPDSFNSAEAYFEYVVINDDGNDVTETITKGDIVDLKSDNNGDIWVYNNSHSEEETGWSISVHDTYMITENNLESSIYGNEYIIKKGSSEKFRINFLHDTTIEYGSESYVVFAGVYDITNDFEEYIDLFSQAARNYFNQPVAYGFSKAENVKSAIDIGILNKDGTYFRSAGFNYSNEDYILNLLIGGSNDNNVNSIISSARLKLTDSSVTKDMDLNAEEINFRWVTGNEMEFPGDSDFSISLTANIVSVASEKIVYDSTNVNNSDYLNNSFIISNNNSSTKGYIIIKNDITVTDKCGKVADYTIKSGTYKYYGSLNLLDKNVMKDMVRIGEISEDTVFEDVEEHTLIIKENIEGGIYEN